MFRNRDCVAFTFGFVADLSSLFFERAPQLSNDDASCTVIGGGFNSVVDIEDQLGHVVVPVEGNNGFRREPAAMGHIDWRRGRCCKLKDVVHDGTKDLRRGNDPVSYLAHAFGG